MWKLVVGDVVLLQAGDLVPADSIIIESSQNFQVGEEVDKEFVECNKSYEVDPFLFADSHVLVGTAKVVVVCVGNSDTCSRREPDELNLTESSDLQKKLKVLANNFTFIGIWSALIILGASIIMLSIQKGVNSELDWKQFVSRLMDAITLTVILIIVAIPEGLPMVITVSLAFCVKLMV